MIRLKFLVGTLGLDHCRWDIGHGGGGSTERVERPAVLSEEVEEKF